MARTAHVTLVAVALVAVALMSTTAQAQQQGSSAVQETPGLLERIMTNYVYPLRDMDWRTMVRNVLENMMNYIAPDAKEPKIGGAQDRASMVVRNLLARAVHYMHSVVA